MAGARRDGFKAELSFLRDVDKKVPFAYQLIKKPGVHRFVRGVHVVSAERFLAGLV